MVMHGTLTIQQEEQALLIPDSAVRLSHQQLEEIATICAIPMHKGSRDQGMQQAVWVLRDNGLHCVGIKTGLYDGTTWQVLEGLHANDQVVTGIQPPPKENSFSFKL